MKKKYIEVLIKNPVLNYQPGTLKTVSKGYARNYLIPYNFAKIPSKNTKKYLNQIEQNKLHAQEKLLLMQQELKVKLEIIKRFTFKKKASDMHTLFGRVTDKDILDTIHKTTGSKLSKYKISENSIKSIGIHNIFIELGHNIKAEIELQILPDTKK